MIDVYISQKRQFQDVPSGVTLSRNLLEVSGSFGVEYIKYFIESNEV